MIASRHRTTRGCANTAGRLLVAGLVVFIATGSATRAEDQRPDRLLRTYCFDCHGDDSGEAGLDLTRLAQDKHDGTLVFENIATGKMPPPDADQPSTDERRSLLRWLADRQEEPAAPSFRRLSRFEFVQSANDLLGTSLNLAGRIPEDRGTRVFDSSRRIPLSREALSSYFAVADEMLNVAFPQDGVPNERTWITSKLKDSHHTYNVYVRDYKQGVLFSWTRANNGNSYGFFYDNFDPPVPGWYELTFDAAKVGDFEEDVSVQIHAGKYYYADDRPQPQRLLDVLSIGHRDLQSHTTRVFLNPGENVSVHCYSRHTWREKSPERGAYIRQLTVRGPIQEGWPPRPYRLAFGGLPIKSAEPGETRVSGATGFRTNLEQIGGSLSVSSFQTGMEKERMQDGSNKTFWHTRFRPTVAEPPHYVLLENPRGVEIEGLSYAAWTGGNGNGQVKKYAVHVSDDGRTWGEPIAVGELETRLANEQPIDFPQPTTRRYIRFLVIDAVSLDGKSLASIGKLDVVVKLTNQLPTTGVTVASRSATDLRQVIRRFAERAFSATLTETELAPYFDIAQRALRETGDFVAAAKLGFKSIICSPRFLLVPGEHSTRAEAQRSTLARILWLSVPDHLPPGSIHVAAGDGLSREVLVQQIDRMLSDERSNRMIASFTAQWLNLRSWDKVSPSLKLYPDYDDLLHHYLPLETRAYLAHMIRENRPVGHLIDSDYTFLNQRLAQHYGVAGVIGQRLRRVTLRPEDPRGGLLTMGSVLKITTDGFDTSPILRGAWLSKNVVGTPISPPPEPVKAIEPEHGSGATTLRAQIAQHKNNESCAACHRHIDPYGFALESFDATGQWRDRYRVEEPHKGTFQYRRNGYFKLTGDVDASGAIDGRRFSNIFGLKRILLTEHRRVAYNVAKKFFEYANGHEPTLRQRADLYDMLDDDPDQCRMRDLISEVLVYSLTEGS